MAFDYLVENLKCLKCENISEADDSTHLQTSVFSDPEGNCYKVGSKVDFNLSEIADLAYFKLNSVKESEPIYLLETWECSQFKAVMNWAEIVIHNNQIVSINSVDLNVEVISRCHFISDICDDIAADLLKKNKQDLSEKEIIEALKTKID